MQNTAQVGYYIAITKIALCIWLRLLNGLQALSSKVRSKALDIDLIYSRSLYDALLCHNGPKNVVQLL